MVASSASPQTAAGTGIGPGPARAAAWVLAAHAGPLARPRRAVDLGGRVVVGVVAERGENRAEALLAGAARRNLCVHVADERIAEATVAAKEIDDVLAGRARVV